MTFSAGDQVRAVNEINSLYHHGYVPSGTIGTVVGGEPSDASSVVVEFPSFPYGDVLRWVVVEDKIEKVLFRAGDRVRITNSPDHYPPNTWEGHETTVIDASQYRPLLDGRNVRRPDGVVRDFHWMPSGLRLIPPADPPVTDDQPTTLEDRVTALETILKQFANGVTHLR